MRKLLLALLLTACSSTPVRHVSSAEPDPAAIQRGMQLASHFGLSLYHWNIQYVWGSPETEDALVRQSFDPILDLYAAHPTWHTTFEMQGYMVEVLAQRHPQVLKKLQALVSNGQVELVSCHYSDQFVLAYVREDLERSLAINDAVFAKYGMKLSPVIFLQEDQFSEGIAAVLAAHGRTIGAVMGGWNQFREEPIAPYYDLNGTTVVLANHGAPWLFYGDAELAAVNANTNPYTYYVGQYIGLQDWYKKSDKTLKKLEDQLSQFEKSGGKIAAIGEYVQSLEAAAIPKRPMGQFLDKMRGNFTNNVFLWMGDNRDQVAEDDERVVSGNYRASQLLRAAEKAVAWGRKQGLTLPPDYEGRIEDSWRTLMLAEVSDSTGLGFPLSIEVKTSIRMAERVQSTSSVILDGLKHALHAASIAVDTKTGDVIVDGPAAPEGQVADKGPVEVSISGGVGKRRVSWRKFTDEKYEVTVDWFPILPGSVSFTLDHPKIGFPRTEDKVIYSPSLLENELREYPLSSFDFKGIYLPLGNGLIGLGNGWYVIKNAAQNHVAARVEKASNLITFETRNPPMRRHSWKFLLVHGSPEDALREADRYNVHPIINR